MKPTQPWCPNFTEITDITHCTQALSTSTFIQHITHTTLYISTDVSYTHMTPTQRTTHSTLLWGSLTTILRNVFVFLLSVSWIILLCKGIQILQSPSFRKAFVYTMAPLNY